MHVMPANNQQVMKMASIPMTHCPGHSIRQEYQMDFVLVSKQLVR